jgi:hypothetical protein
VKNSKIGIYKKILEFLKKLDKIGIENRLENFLGIWEYRNIEKILEHLVHTEEIFKKNEKIRKNSPNSRTKNKSRRPGEGDRKFYQLINSTK